LRTDHAPDSRTGPLQAENTVPVLSGHEGSASPSLTGGSVLLAWVLSISLHVAGLGSLLLVVFPFTGVESSQPPPPRIMRVVGDVDVVPSGGAPATQPTISEQAAAFEGTDRVFRPDASPGAEALGRLSGAGSAERESGLSIIGIGGPGGVGAGVGIGTGDGDMARGGITLGGGGGPGFFGLNAAVPGVRTIVYVVDRSASMLDTFAAVKAELKRSISALRRSQKFHVIFFNSGDPVENPPMRPVNAVDANKREFFEFLETVTPYNGTHPDRAMQRALALEPDLIYFLTDGLFDAELVNRLDEWNRARRTRIYTIAYMDQGGRRLLEAIARQHGGECKFVTEDDLP